MSSIWTTSKVHGHKIFVRLQDGIRWGLVRFVESKGVYFGTLTENYEDMTVDTTKHFLSAFEAMLWIDLMLNNYYDFEYPEDYPKGISCDFSK